MRELWRIVKDSVFFLQADKEKKFKSCYQAMLSNKLKRMSLFTSWSEKVDCLSFQGLAICQPG